MPVKELTALTVTTLWKEFNLSFRDYWLEHDKAVKSFKKRLIGEVLDAERSMWISAKPYEQSGGLKSYKKVSIPPACNIFMPISLWLKIYFMFTTINHYLIF